MGKKTHIAKLCLGLIILLALINLLAVFSPEIGFDALWYHLTLPKLFLLQHRWYYPGGLLYYSAMPRLAETLFIPLLALFGATGPKLLQFISGLVITYLTYLLARNWFDQTRSALGALLFYATWLVSWQSGSAYVDLIRAVFETIALLLALKGKHITSGIFLGLALGTKWHALGSLLIFGLIFSPLIPVLALITAIPWILLAWHLTGNPFYPLLEPFMYLTQLQQVPGNFFRPLIAIQRLISIPIHLSFPFDDMLNPLLGPLFIIGATKKNRLLLFSLLGLVYWQLTPPPSSRYLLPYLPAVIVVGLSALDFPRLNRVLTFLIFSTTILIIFGRSSANSRYLPVILNRQTVNQFLAQNSIRLPDTFIDTDDWVETNIPVTSRVLVSSWHNLFYIPTNFDHESWTTNNYYDYLITRRQTPAQINGQLLHTNSIGVQIFKLNEN